MPVGTGGGGGSTTPSDADVAIVGESVLIVRFDGESPVGFDGSSVSAIVGVADATTAADAPMISPAPDGPGELAATGESVLIGSGTADAAQTLDASWASVSLTLADGALSLDAALQQIGGGDQSSEADSSWIAILYAPVAVVAADADATVGEAWTISTIAGSGVAAGFTDAGSESEAVSVAASVFASEIVLAADARWIAATLLGAESGAAGIGIVDLGLAGDAGFVGTIDAGYNIYSNTGMGDPIDYASPIATVIGLENTGWTSSTLAAPGTWSFGVRAFDGNGEEQNLDCALTIILDATGNDITNRPAAPSGLRAFPTAGGGIRVEWFCPPVNGPKKAAGFHVYTGTGGSPDYSSPAATVGFGTGIFNAFVANLALAGGTTYSVGVRAYNAIGEEPNVASVSVLADATGPAAVDGLTATAIV